MKIAIITGVYPKVSETFVVNQVRTFKSQFELVDFFCLRADTIAVSTSKIKASILRPKYFTPSGTLQRYQKALGIINILKRKHLMPFLRTTNFFKYGFSALNGRQFFKTYYEYFFDVNNYDVIHINFGTTAIEILPLLRKFSNKIVVSFHGFDVQKFDRTYYQELMGLSNIAYTVNSNYLKKQVIDLGFKTSKIHILPTPIEDYFFKELKPKADSNDVFNILFVGRLIQLKGPDRAIHIVKQFAEENSCTVRLHIVGSGIYEDKCKRIIDNFGLADIVEMYNDLSHIDVQQIMYKSDVFIFPAIVDDKGRAEAQGIVLQEAQAMGLPVIVSNVGGIKEGVINNVTGFVVTENTFSAFVEKLNYLHKKPHVRKKLGIAGRKYIEQNFNNQSFMKKYQKIISI